MPDIAMTIATLNTPHFEFVTLGITPVDCRKALRKAWNKHRRQTGAEWTFDDVIEDINYIILKPGQVARDGRVLV